MRLGLYIFASLTFIAIIGAFVFTVNPNDYIIEIMGVNFKFSMIVWVISPMILLLIFTVAHMSYYGLKGYFKQKKWQKDSMKLEDALYCAIAREPKKHKYSIPEISACATLLDKSQIKALDNVEGLSPKLSKMLSLIRRIENGEYIDLRENKLSHLFNEGNVILAKNRVNRLESDEKFVEEVMKSNTSYSDMVREKALEIFANKESFFKAKQYAKVFDKSNFFVMLNRLDQEEDLELTDDTLDSFVSSLKLSCIDFTKIANITKKHFKPDRNLALFKKYQLENDKAQSAYLYLLFEYELMDEVRSYLDEQDDKEFIKARAILELKTNSNISRHYRVEDLIDVEKSCL